jgi:hypothetical protein
MPAVGGDAAVSVRAFRYAQLSSELTPTMTTRQARPHVIVHCTVELRYHELGRCKEDDSITHGTSC